MQLFLF